MTEPTPHLTLDVLADYFAEVLDDPRQEAVELHIADCDRCAESAQWIHSLPRPDLESWNVRAHAEAALTPVLDSALAGADVPSTRPGIPERLERWRRRLASETLHLIKETSGRLSRGLDVLMPPPGWELGMGRLRTGTATTFRPGDPAAGAEPAAETPTIRVVRRGIGVEVRVEPVDPDEEPGLVALVPARQGERAAVQVLEPARDDPRARIARFEQDDGDFVVVLEPRAGDSEPSAD